jgi:lysophospholipase L1-like esterase
VRRRGAETRLILIVVALGVATVSVVVGLIAGPGTSQAAPSAHPYELTLGDSYSIGYQPGLGGTPGYSAYIARRLKLQVANLGCGGATTSSLLHSVGCGDPAGQDAVPYTGITQEQAALNFIATHPGKVGLVTVSIGGNDFDGCSSATCVQAAIPTMGANISTLLSALRTALTQASDAATPIIGLTYPDVNLGLYVYPTHPATAANLASAQQSVLAFDQLINPTLGQAYHSVAGASFVNVTSAPYKTATQGDDTPLTTTQSAPPYGKVPASVAEVCQLTWFCSQGNIHATTKGYNFIGSLVVARYRSL